MALAERWLVLRPAESARSYDVIEASLLAALASARAAAPDLEVPDDEFLVHLATCLPDTPLPDALASVTIADLYFACAILRGDGAALRAFEVVLLPSLDAAVAHLDGGSALLTDVKTAVRDRVLAHGGAGKIAEYHGRGSLGGWLRVVAVREALQLVRSRRREVPAERAESLAAALHIEPPLLTANEQRIYREGFTTALSTLTPRERNLLRQHYLHGATVAELGAFYAVHGATAARWIAQIRETLLRRTRHEIGQALRLTGTELDSAMAKAADHLDYSLRHTLSHEH
jgi:RNA polymerase sigma-70 factor (ECF subfamily)